MEVCKEILKLDMRNVKALLRCAIAYEFMGEFKKGLAKADVALSLHLSGPFLNEAIKIQSRLKRLIALDDVVTAKESRPPHLLSAFHSLRINFLATLPNTYELNSTLSVRLCITNEFGLWDRTTLLSPLSHELLPLKLRIESITISSDRQSLLRPEHMKTLTNALAFGADGKVSHSVQCFPAIFLSDDLFFLLSVRLNSTFKSTSRSIYHRTTGRLCSYYGSSVTTSCPLGPLSSTSTPCLSYAEARTPSVLGYPAQF